MVLRIHKNTKPNLYGRYFLASEADDEKTEEEVKPETATRRNVKVITVKPNNRSKQFADVDIGEEETTPETTTDDTGADEPVTDDNTDYSADDTENTPDTTTDATPATGDAGGDNQETGADDAPETGDETDFSDTGDDPNTTDDTSDAGDDTNADDAPETGDDTDFTDAAGDETGVDDDGTTDAGGEDAANQGTSDEKEKPGVEYDSTRKYNLFKEYMSLYNACDNYISKLENILKDDTVQNQIIRTSVNNLRDIKDIIYDYMTIKYPINSYIQSLLFYQKMKVSIQLIFALLKNSKNNSDTVKH